MPRNHTLNLEQISLEQLELHLRKGGLRRASSTVEVRRGIRVQLRDASGKLGVGESLPMVSAGTEAMHEVVDVMMQTKERLQGRSDSLEGLIAMLRRDLAGYPATRCGLDVAMHDLEARLRGVPLAQRLSADARNHVEVNALIGAMDLAESLAEAHAAILRGYRTLKLKIGRAPIAADLMRIGAIRSSLGSDVRLRLDANGAWDFDTAKTALHALSDYDIEMVEQPVAAEDLDGLAALHACSPVPIAADESLASATGRERLMRGELAGIAVVKPMVQGGLADSAHLCREASARGVRIVVTTTFDGPAATAASLHLATAFGSPTLAHGLASCEVIDAEFPECLIPRGGLLHLSDAPGLGIDPVPIDKASSQ